MLVFFCRGVSVQWLLARVSGWNLAKIMRTLSFFHLGNWVVSHEFAGLVHDTPTSDTYRIPISSSRISFIVINPLQKIGNFWMENPLWMNGQAVFFNRKKNRLLGKAMGRKSNPGRLRGEIWSNHHLGCTFQKKVGGEAEIQASPPPISTQKSVPYTLEI